MKKTVMALAILLGAGFLAAPAKANGPGRETRTVSSGFRLQNGEVDTVNLSGWGYVEKIYVQAEGIYRDATFEVIANGEVKGTVYVPGRDPSYVVTIRETVQSLQFRHINGGDVRIRSVVAEMSGSVAMPWTLGNRPMSFEARNQAMQVASQTISVVQALEDHLDYLTYGNYILPIKKSAARLYAVAAARGDLSGKTQAALMTLGAQIHTACRILDQQLAQNATFDLATEMMTIEEQIKDILN
jgi:hypothetical protein